MYTEASPATLADVLEARRAEIIHRWSERLGEGFVTGHPTKHELEHYIDAFLSEAMELLHSHAVASASQVHGESEAGRALGRVCFRLGSDVKALLHAYHMLRETLFDLVRESGVPVSLLELRALTAFIASSTAEAVAEYIQQRDDAHRLDQERLQALMDNAPVAIFAKDVDGRYIISNRYFQELVGHTREEILGQDDRLLLSPQQAVTLRADDAKALAGRSFRFEQTIKLPSGPRTFLTVKFPLPGSENMVPASGGISTDITDQKRTEAVLRETSQRLQAILGTVADGILTTDACGTLLSVNPAVVRLFGYTSEELLGRDIGLLIPEAEEGEAQDSTPGSPCLDVLAGRGTQREVLGRRKDGSVFPMELQVSEYLLPQGRFFTGTVRDITERKRAEETQALFVEAGMLLSQSLDLPSTLKSIVALVARRMADVCAVDLLGEDGRVQRLSVATRDPSWQAVAIRGMAYPPRLGSSSPVARALERGVALVVPEITPTWMDAAAQSEGHRAFMEDLHAKSLICVPLVARGRKLGLLNFVWRHSRAATIATDLELAWGMADRAAVAIDNARLYQQAQEAIRMREDVVAMVSHDLRNPLNAITLAATALLKRDEVSTRTAKAVSRIYAAADRASRMIRELLDFTQARVGGIPIQYKPLDIHEHVRRVVEEVQLAWPDRRIDFQARGDGRCEGDEGRLAQVVTNLVGNALQHGLVDEPVNVSIRGEESDVVLEVHNGGKPISPKLLPSLFEPYRRGAEPCEGRRGSLGLGLYISRQIILGHGGSIDVHSTAEDGTTFTVRLPRHATPG
ncbi:PAS domain S-box protein [Archangium lansingense]|uniref:sensor histidine kinase n=1 Tax=Archangium lansingense TaxID=2995310 RepID=UPI003B7A14A2